MDIKNQPSTLLIAAIVMTVAVLTVTDVLPETLLSVVLVMAISAMVTRLVLLYRDLSI